MVLRSNRSVFSQVSIQIGCPMKDNIEARGSSSSASAGQQGNDFQWHKIWQMSLPNKVKMFVWHFIHNSLAVRRNLARRGVKTETSCPVYGQLDEDCRHLFFKCKQARAWWRVMGLDHTRDVLQHSQSGKEVMQHIWCLNQETQLKIITFLWRWWMARNKANVGSTVLSLVEI